MPHYNSATRRNAFLFKFVQPVGLLILALMFFLPTSSFGANSLLPNIPPALKGKKCVAPIPVMRRDHMKFLFQHRYKVVHDGIRTKKYNLNQCLACHVPPAKKGVDTTALEHNNSANFCINCHRYVGVKIDCFECHAKRPPGDAHFHSLTAIPISHPGHELTGDVKLVPQELKAITTQESDNVR